MFEKVETLMALSHHKTMTKAAQALRLTQSTISKRIKALESEVGFLLVQRDGRRVILTQAGLQLVARLTPLITSIKDELLGCGEQTGPTLSLGVAESLMSSWAAGPVAEFETGFAGLIDLNSHRSPAIIERLLSGALHAGVISGRVSANANLKEYTVGVEPMVLLNPRAEPRTKVYTIEPSSSTWMAIERSVSRAGFERAGSLQTFSCVAQYALASGRPSLVPLGICAALGIKKKHYEDLSPRHILRPISLVYRPTLLRIAGMEAQISVLAGLLGRALKRLRDK